MLNLRTLENAKFHNETNRDDDNYTRFIVKSQNCEIRRPSITRRLFRNQLDKVRSVQYTNRNLENIAHIAPLTNPNLSCRPKCSLHQTAPPESKVDCVNLVFYRFSWDVRTPRRVGRKP